MQQPIEVFIINLPRDTERRAAITTQFDRMGIHYRIQGGEVFTATDDEKLDRLVELNQITQTARESMNRGGIGCTMSHHAIYQKMIDEDIPMAVILEDDAELSPLFPSILSQIPSYLRNDELLLLFYRYTQVGHFEVSTFDRIDLGDGVGLYPPMRRNMHSSMGYAISREVAHGLLQANTPIEFLPDVWSQLFHRGAFKTIRITYPRCIEQRDVPSTRLKRAAAPSTMRSSRPLKQRLEQWAATMTPLRQVLDRRRRMETTRTTTPRFVDTPSPYRPGAAGSQASQAP